MRLLYISLILAIFIASTFSLPKPQDDVAEEIFGKGSNVDDDNSERYGTSGNDNIDPSIIDDVFGSSNNDESKTGTYNDEEKSADSTDDGNYNNDDNAQSAPSTNNKDDGYTDTKSEESNDKDEGKAAAQSSSYTNQIVDVKSDDCAFYANEGYKCVPYYNCEDGEIITDGGGLIDIRSGFGAVLDPAGSKCEGYLEVCCRNPDFEAKEPTTTPAPRTTTTPAPPAPYVSQCGRRNVDGVKVRINNNPYEGSTQFGEWPHMCAVLEKKTISGGDTINLYVCGASLIAPGVVLTGAHCVAKLNEENTKVRCGEWDTQQAVEPIEHEDRDVQKIVMHPLFDRRNLQNDFALLILETEFILSEHIDTICLPDNNAGIYSYDPNNCVATGWGKDKFGKEGEYQVIMKQVEMNTVDNTECERRLRRTRLGDAFKLDDSFMCAGGDKNKDTCKGDGGGPLVCPIAGSNSNGYDQAPSQYVQAGIVAWGIDCGVEGNPGVYANVAESLCFIDFATRCYSNRPDYFDVQGCENWIPKEIEEIQKEIDEQEDRFDVLNQDGSNATPSNLRSIKRKIRKLRKQIQSVEDLEDECFIRNNDQQDGNGYGTGEETDLSDLARTGQNTNSEDSNENDETKEQEQ